MSTPGLCTPPFQSLLTFDHDTLESGSSHGVKLMTFWRIIGPHSRISAFEPSLERYQSYNNDVRITALLISTSFHFTPPLTPDVWHKYGAPSRSQRVFLIHMLETYETTWKRDGPIRLPSRISLLFGKNSIELLNLTECYQTKVSAPHHNLFRRMAVTQLSLPLHLQKACQSLNPGRASPPGPCGNYYPHPLPHVSKGKLSSSHTCLPPQTPWVPETTSIQFLATAP